MTRPFTASRAAGAEGAVASRVGHRAGRPRIACLAACGFAVLAGCEEPPQPNGSEPATPVTLFEIAETATPPGARYSANIDAYSVVRVSAQIGGTVVGITQVDGADGKRDIQPGDSVEKGGPLARIDDAPYQQQLDAAEAALSGDTARMIAARDQHDRMVAAGTAVARSQVENSLASYESAKANVQRAKHTVEEARIQLSYCEVTAPRDGLVLQRKVEVGDLVNPGMELFQVADTRRMKVVFGVPPQLAVRIEPGTKLRVVVGALDHKHYEGPVTRVSPSADPKTRVFEIEVTVDNAGGELEVGMIATLQLPPSPVPEAAPRCLVPLDSIVRPPGDARGFAVFVPTPASSPSANDGALVARIRRVTLGHVRGDRVEVTKGLGVGDRVIVRGSTIVHDGGAIRVIP